MSATAHLMDGIERRGHRTVRVYHAALDQPVTLTCRGPERGITRHRGHAACGEPPDRLSEPEPALIEPELSCTGCYLTCRVEGIEVS